MNTANVRNLEVTYEDGDVYAHITDGELIDPITGDAWIQAYCGMEISDDADEYDPESFPVYDAPGICPLCWLAASGGKRIVYAMQGREVSNES